MDRIAEPKVHKELDYLQMLTEGNEDGPCPPGPSLSLSAINQ